MKTLNNFSKFKTIALFAFMAVAITACGGKKGGNNPGGYYPGNGYPYQCNGCAAGSIPLLNTAQFNHGSHFDGNVTVFGVNNGSADMNDPKAIVAYRGDVSIAGQLRVSNPNPYYMCGVPQGLYNLVQSAPIYSEIGVFNNLTLQLVGAPMDVKLVGTGVVYNTNSGIGAGAHGTHRDSPANRLYMNVKLLVNNQPCADFITE